MLSVIIVTFIIVLFYAFYMCISKSKCSKKCRRKKKNKECFQQTEPIAAKSQIMLTDESGNLSTFNLGSNKTFVSDKDGNITTVTTGLFNDVITANKGMTGNVTGNVTGTTGTFSGNIQGNQVKIQENSITFTTGNDKGLLYTNTNNTNWNGTNTPAFKPSDGMVLYGWKDGALGTKNGGDKASLKWSDDGNVSVRGTLSANEITGITDYEVYYNANDTTKHTYSPESGVWTISNNTSWDPKVRGSNRTGNATNTAVNDQDATGNIIEITVPTSQKTAYIHYLSWLESRYFDIYGVLPTSVSPTSQEVFIKRVNSHSDKTVNSTGYHDGVSIAVVPSIDRFQKIRIKGVKGKIYYMGIGFNKTMVGSDVGFIHADNVKGNFGNVTASNGQGLVRLQAGLDGNKVGYVEFRKPNNDRKGYIGWDDGSGYLQLAVESGCPGYKSNGKIVATEFCIDDVCISKQNLLNIRDDVFLRRGQDYGQVYGTGGRYKFTY